MTRRTPKLTLRKETLRQLDCRELKEAAGGAIQTLLPSQCTCTGYYPSLNAPCTTAGDC